MNCLIEFIICMCMCIFKVYIADIKEEVGRKTIDELERRYGEGRCALMVVDITDAKRFEGKMVRFLLLSVGLALGFH